MAKQTTIATAASQRQPRSTSGTVSMARKGEMTTKKALTETGSGSLKGLGKKRQNMRGVSKRSQSERILVNKPESVKMNLPRHENLRKRMRQRSRSLSKGLIK
jgi:hypothetical protein